MAEVRKYTQDELQVKRTRLEVELAAAKETRSIEDIERDITPLSSCLEDLMTETIYRITGVPYKYDSEQRKYVPGDERTTVRRSQKGDLAYYEDLSHAKRGLIGIKTHNGSYSDPRIEVLDGEWEILDG